MFPKLAGALISGGVGAYLASNSFIHAKEQQNVDPDALNS